MRAIAIVMLVAACMTDPAEGVGPLQLFKVTIMDIPVAPAHLYSTGSACVDVPLFDTMPELAGLQPECSFSERFEDGSEQLMQSCVAVPDARPCWQVYVDEYNCFAHDRVAFEIVRDVPATYDHHVLLQCVSI